MIFIREITVTQGDHASIPTVTLQKIKRNRSAVIEIESSYSNGREIPLSGSAGDFRQQLVIELCMNRSRRRAKVRKVGVQLRAIVSNKRLWVERCVRRNQKDRKSTRLNSSHVR